MASATAIQLLSKVLAGKQLAKHNEQFLIDAGYLAIRYGKLSLTAQARRIIKQQLKQD